jgi:hypothetical protein
MKILNLILISFVLVSCSFISSKNKTRNGTNKKKQLRAHDSSVIEEGIQKPENWADEYYQRTYFILQNPFVSEGYNQLMNVCKSNDFNFVVDYQALGSSAVRYKKTPITIRTKKGFSKKVFISKGACRELSLFKYVKISPDKQIRKSIKKMVLIYIYNQGTFLKEIVFNTQFSDVEFLVE